MGVLPQALEIIFKVQMKKSNEKVARRKICFSTYKNIFIYLFGSLLFSNHIFFNFLFILYNLKLL